MKKILVFILLIVLFSCSKEGEIKEEPKSIIKINGKEYRFINIVPSKGAFGVWILIPKDAKVEVPLVTSYNINCGKGCRRPYPCIWIKA